MVKSESILFFKFLLAGMAVGATMGILGFILLLFKKNKVIQFIADIITCLLFTFIFIFLINKLNMGKTRLYLLFAQLIGIFIEKITIGKVFAKLYKWLYNKGNLIKNKFLQTKFGKFISY